MSARIDNDTISMQIKQTSTSSTWNKLSVSPFKTDFSKLLQWNHFALSFGDKQLRIFLNGNNIGTLNVTFSTLNPQSDWCVIGNSASTTDPLNVYLRHLVMLRSGLSLS